MFHQTLFLFLFFHLVGPGVQPFAAHIAKVRPTSSFALTPCEVASWKNQHQEAVRTSCAAAASVDLDNPGGNFRETRRRSVAKAILWRVYSATVSFGNTYFFSKSSTVAFQFVSASFLPKAVLLFLGDQAVASSPIGRVNGADAISRSLAKAAAIRAFSILLNVAIATVALRQHILVAAHIASSDAVVKTFSMFLYERLWAHVRWGKVSI